MSSAKNLYQVIARRNANEVSRAQVGIKPLQFGSGAAADLRLTGENIAPVAGRVLLLGTDRIMLTNLSNPPESMKLDDKPVPPAEPVIWKPGARLTLADYTFELTMNEVAEAEAVPSRAHMVAEPSKVDSPTVHPSLPVTPPPRTAPEEETLNTLSATPPDAFKTTGWAMESLAREDETPLATEDVVPGKVPEFTQLMQTVSDQTLPYTSDRPTEAYAGPIPNILIREEDVTGYTLRKDWQDEGELSAQIMLTSINFAPGERVLIPLTIRNNYTHPVELLFSLAGLPDDWAVQGVPSVQLSPGQQKMMELVIQTQRYDGLGRMDGMLRMYDRQTPEIAITVPLHMVIKRQPDLVGGFDPPRVVMGKRLYLVLQNHTLSNMTVALSLGDPNPDFRIVLSQTKVELTPNQNVRMPVMIEVERRAFFQRKHYQFHVFAQQGTRAPLDFTGVVTVHPRINLPFLLAGLMLVVLTAVGIGLLSFSLFAVSPFAPTATPTATFTPMPTASPRPTVTPFPTATEPPTPAFTDPRTAACQRSVPIPDGWEIYVVVAGDRLIQLGRRFDFSYLEIARVNCRDVNATIFVGDELLVPIQQGETIPN